MKVTQIFDIIRPTTGPVLQTSESNCTRLRHGRCFQNPEKALTSCPILRMLSLRPSRSCGEHRSSTGRALASLFTEAVQGQCTCCKTSGAHDVSVSVSGAHAGCILHVSPENVQGVVRLQLPYPLIHEKKGRYNPTRRVVRLLSTPG